MIAEIEAGIRTTGQIKAIDTKIPNFLGKYDMRWCEAYEAVAAAIFLGRK